MLPFLFSKQEGYGVIVLNPNENYIEVESRRYLSSHLLIVHEPAEKRERKDKVSKEKQRSDVISMREVSNSKRERNDAVIYQSK